MSKGLNFAPTPKYVPKDQYICNLEPIIQNLPAEVRPNLRLQVTNALNTYRYPKSNLTKNESIALKTLSQYEDIKIIPSDKGRTTVIMDTIDYENKVSNLINDDQTYLKVPKDPTTRIENSLRKILKKWQDSNFIDETTYKRLLILNGRLPQFYALPKIHKEGIPLRPIVSYCASPLYQLAKFLQNILRPLTLNNDYVIKIPTILLTL